MIGLVTQLDARQQHQIDWDQSIDVAGSYLLPFMATWKE